MDILTNKTELAGKICSEITPSHTVFDEKFYSATLEVKRLSGCPDFIPLTLSEKLIATNSLTPDKFICLSGQLRSYNYYKHEEFEDSKRSKLVITAFCKDAAPFQGYINDVYLDGFVCKPPVYRSTPFGKQICDLLLAVNRSYGKSDYIPVIFWGNNAAEAAKLKVGSHITVTGRIQSRDYEKFNACGEKQMRTTYEGSGFKLTSSGE